MRIIALPCLMAGLLIGCESQVAEGAKAVPAEVGSKNKSPAPAPAIGDPVASCRRVPSLSVCTNLHPDAFALGEAFQEDACAAASGRFEPSPCPEEGRIGRCDIGGGQVRIYYRTGAVPFEIDGARSDCTRLYRGEFEAASGGA